MSKQARGIGKLQRGFRPQFHYPGMHLQHGRKRKYDKLSLKLKRYNALLRKALYLSTPARYACVIPLAWGQRLEVLLGDIQGQPRRLPESFSPKEWVPPVQFLRLVYNHNPQRYNQRGSKGESATGYGTSRPSLHRADSHWGIRKWREILPCANGFPIYRDDALSANKAIAFSLATL